MADADTQAVAGLDPLRGAILSGRRVVVITERSLESHAREAATVAGRLDELRVLHFTSAPSPPYRVRADSRVEPGHEALCEAGAAALLDGVPEDEAEKIVAEAGILVCMVNGALPSGPHLQRILGGIVEGRGSAGRLGPVLFFDILIANGLPGYSGRDPWIGCRPVPSLGKDCIQWTAPGYREPTDEAVSSEAWDEAVSRCMAGVETGGGNGLAWCRGNGRLTIARTGTPERGRNLRVPLAQVFEIGPDGWCQGWCIPVPAESPWTAEGLAALAWRGGLALVVRKAYASRLPWDQNFLKDAPAALVRERRDGTVYPSALEAVGDLMDHELLASLPGYPTDHAVVRAIAASPAGIRYRRDFALTWPAFADLLINPRIRADIDAGKRTLPIVAGHLGVSEAVARRLIGRSDMPQCCATAGVLAGDIGASELRLGDFLSAIGHDRLPAPGDAGEWEAFIACCYMLMYLLVHGRFHEPSPVACARLLLASGRDWRARRPKITNPAIMKTAGSVGDMVGGFAGWLAAISGAPVTQGAAFDLLSRHGSLARLVTVSDDWHANPHLSQGIPEIPDTASWPMPFGIRDLGEGWSVVPITNPRQLRDEGGHGPDEDGLDGLAHCVGSYARACWEGRSLILSVRRDTGAGPRRMTTAELRPKHDGFFRLGEIRYELTQHCGLRNAGAPMGAIRAMGRLMDDLSRDRIPIDASALGPRSNEPPRVAVRERALALSRAWRAILPRALAAMDPVALADLAAGGRAREAA